MDISGLHADVNTLLEYHMNEASTIMSDERDYLRPWRRRLRDILITKNEETLRFLEKPQEEWPAEQQHSRFFQTIRNLPAGSTWMRSHVENVVDTESIRNAIESDVGFSILTVRTNIHVIMEKYQATLRNLFEYNDKIETNIQKLDELYNRLSRLPDLDATSPASIQLQNSIIAYVDSCYESWGIRHDYESFCKTYAEFMAYRSILLPLQAAADTQGSPVCSICTTDRVTMALNPCGHVFCNSCGQKQRSQCYICRCSVTNRLRIYFN